MMYQFQVLIASGADRTLLEEVWLQVDAGSELDAASLVHKALQEQFVWADTQDQLMEEGL